MALNPRIHIAIADDLPIVISGFRFLISSFPGCVLDIEASNGVTLLEKMQHTRQLPDICFLDIKMPVLDGFDTLKIMKEKWPQLKVVMQSYYAQEQNIIRAFLLGASAFVSKDASPEEIEKTIREVYENEVYYSPWITKTIIAKLHDKANLTELDLELLKYCCQGLTHKDVSLKINKSLRTVDDYYDNLCKKLNVKDKVGLAIYAVKAGIV